MLKRVNKRQPDAGDSAHIPDLFLRLVIFLFAVPAPVQVMQVVHSTQNHVRFKNFTSIYPGISTIYGIHRFLIG